MHENIDWVNVGIFLLIMCVFAYLIHLVQSREKTVFKDDSEKRFENIELD